MAIVAADEKVRLSVKTGSAGNSTAGTPAGSLGKYMATTDLTDNSLNNLFRDITAAETAAGITLYRCVFLYNSHATLTYEAVKAWLDTQTSGGGTLAIGLDPAGVVDFNASAAQAAEIANETTAPSGVTFSTTAVDLASALSIGDMAPGKVQAIWLRLVVSAGAAAVADAGTLEITGNTAP